MMTRKKYKRKFGFLARKKTRSSVKILVKRRRKGRKRLAG